MYGAQPRVGGRMISLAFCSLLRGTKGDSTAGKAVKKSPWTNLLHIYQTKAYNLSSWIHLKMLFYGIIAPKKHFYCYLEKH